MPDIISNSQSSKRGFWNRGVCLDRRNDGIYILSILISLILLSLSSLKKKNNVVLNQSRMNKRRSFPNSRKSIKEFFLNISVSSSGQYIVLN